MKRILVILTINRICEKIVNIIPELSKIFTVDIYCVGEMSIRSNWYGNNDPRLEWRKKYFNCANSIIDGPEFQNVSDVVDITKCDFNLRDFDLVIYDDNRIMEQLCMPKFYQMCKKLNIPVVGNSHGNQEYNKNNINGINISYDKLFLLGNEEKVYYSQYSKYENFYCGGIPINDELKYYKLTKEYILIITNFLSNHSEGSKLFKNNFNRELVSKLGLEYISKKLNLPIKIKQKTRLDDKNYAKNIEYIKNCFTETEVEVITDTNEINDVISKSALTISALSTLAFKSIQLGIPTCLINYSGQLGNFKNFYGIIDNEEQLIRNLSNQTLDNVKRVSYLKKVISGGDNFTSTLHYIRNIKTILHDE